MPLQLNELVKLVTESDSSDWHKIDGPAYHLEIKSNYSEVGGTHKERWVDIEEHRESAVYRGDISITMAWGLAARQEFHAEWAKKLDKVLVSSHFVDVFYNNALVFRETYVSVDEARAYLPIPRLATELKVPKAYANFIQMLDSLSNQGESRSYFQRVGFKATDEQWPIL